MSSRKSQKSHEMQDANKRIAHILDHTAPTITEWAETVGFSREHLSAVKHGKAEVTGKLARAFEKASRYRGDWILYGTGAMRIADDGAVYVLGPLSRPPQPPSTAEVLHRPAYHCGLCYGEVARGATVCPHCGGGLMWLDESEEKP